MTEVTYNDIVLDIPEDEVVALNKQVNDIAKLDSFKSDFTREFKVKRTRAMEALFENAATINTQTEKPYQSLFVNVTFNGEQVVNQGRMAINRADELYYYCSVYSGAVNFFDIIKEITINAIDLSDLDHTWNAATAADSLDNDEDYQYLACDFSDDGGLLADTDPMVFQIEILRPFIRVSRLFNDIFDGYNLESDIATDALFLKMFMPINTLNVTSAALTNYYAEVDTNQYTGVPNGTTAQLLLNGTIVYDPKSIVSQTDNTVTAPFNAQFTFVFDRFYIKWSDRAHRLYLTVNGVEGVADVYRVDIGDDYFQEVLIIDLVYNDVVRFYFENNAVATVNTIGNNYFRIGNINYDKISAGSPIIVQNHLPSIKQSDFVKAICNFFGLVPDYDSLTNTIRLWGINRLYSNKTIARDWSDYLSSDSEDIEFRLDYARLNWMKWKDDKDVGEGNGNAFIPLNDQNAAKEKTIYTMPFAYCDEVSYGTEVIARIGWFESIPDSTSYKELDKITERIVTREVLGRDMAIDASTPNDAFKARVQSLDLSTSINYNYSITKMLEKTKAIKRNFNLPVTEVVNLDHSIPVFLSQYSEYFFVKKISNYIEGRLCSVELIRL